MPHSHPVFQELRFFRHTIHDIYIVHAYHIYVNGDITVAINMFLYVFIYVYIEKP